MSNTVEKEVITKKAEQVLVGDFLEIDMGWGSATDRVFCEVTGVQSCEQSTDPVIAVDVQHNNETFSCAFKPEDEIRVK